MESAIKSGYYIEATEVDGLETPCYIKLKNLESLPLMMKRLWRVLTDVATSHPLQSILPTMHKP